MEKMVILDGKIVSFPQVWDLFLFQKMKSFETSKFYKYLGNYVWLLSKLKVMPTARQNW